MYLWSAYNLVWIWKGNQWKTTFIIPTGHYEYQVILYRLDSALHIPELHGWGVPGVFPLVWHHLLYISYILIYSWNLELIIITTSLLFWKSWENSSWLKNVSSTCHPHTSSDISTPKWEFKWTRGRGKLFSPVHNTSHYKDLQCFLGFAHFDCFIHNYSTIAAPLTLLLKSKPKSLPWNTQCFLSSPQVLLHHCTRLHSSWPWADFCSQSWCIYHRSWGGMFSATGETYQT